MISLFRSVAASPEEISAARAGDDIISRADVVMDRAFTVDATPDSVWPWLLQLGKRRAGWYLPRSVERFLPPGRRAARSITPAWQDLAIGDTIPDYGGKNATFEVAMLQAPAFLVYRSARGRTSLTWSITLTPVTKAHPDHPGSGTRVYLRLRLKPVRRTWLAAAGEVIDILTIAGMAAGLRERLEPVSAAPSHDR